MAANVKSIKHMAFAVRNAEAALQTYIQLLAVPAETPVVDYMKSRNRVAVFQFAGIEYQLCQSMDTDGRFATWIGERGAEGLHHICYEVASIDEALYLAQQQGARLRACKACRVEGSHPHPEGFVAFLDSDASGVEIEFMQVYTAEELAQYNAVKGI